MSGSGAPSCCTRVGAVVTAWSTTARAASCEVRASQGTAWRAAGEAAAGRAGNRDGVERLRLDSTWS